MQKDHLMKARENMTVIKKNRKVIAVICAWLMAIAIFMVYTADKSYGDDILGSIKDGNFRNYIERSFDFDHDGQITQQDVDRVTVMDVDNADIESLEGIEIFANLKELSCRGNHLTELDLKGNTKLEKLNCESNDITLLDLSGNPELTDLNCYGNELSALDVSGNTKLKNLQCGDNSFSTIDLSRNTALESFAYIGGSLEQIDLSHNTELRSLWITAAPLKSLDLSNNDKLEAIVCTWTEIRTLDLRDKPYLQGENVNVSYNEMISLHSDIPHGSEVSAYSERAINVDLPCGETSYDLRKIDPEIMPQYITGVSGGSVEDATVSGIYDGMELTYTYTENGVTLAAGIVFHVENDCPAEPSDETGGDGTGTGSGSVITGQDSGTENMELPDSIVSIEKVPETGDNTVTYAAAIIACIVLGGAVTVLIGARKKKGM